MNRAEHYQLAEQLAEQAASRIREGAEADADRLIALAQVHATLAASADNAALATVLAAAGRRDSAAPALETRNTRSRVTDHVAVRGLGELSRDMLSHPGDKQA